MRFKSNINYCYLRALKHILVMLIGSIGSMVISTATIAGDTKLTEVTISDLQKALNLRDLTSVDLVDRYLARIETYDYDNAELNSIIRINPRAREIAAQLDEERQAKGPRSLLHGIPIIVKDNYNTYDLPTSAGSVALAGFVPSSDAFQVKKLRDAGAVILAKANMDEHAFNNDGVSSLGGQTKNAYDYTRNPGGSSAGTAVAIAANFGAAGLGTDTCGSITIPAAFNSLVGLRPTKGLTSVAGVIPLLDTDVTGPMTRTVEDLAIFMDVMQGYDANDPATNLVKSRVSSGFVKGLGSIELSTLRLGRLESQFTGSDFTANKVIEQGIQLLEEKGVTFVTIDESVFESLLKSINATTALEYKQEIAAYFEKNPGSGFKSIEEIVEAGIYHRFMDRYQPVIEGLKADYDPQQAKIRKQWMSLLNQAVDQVMKTANIDALVFPTLNAIPPKLKEGLRGIGMMNGLSCASGVPQLSLPMGLTAAGLPIGLSLIGKSLSDENLVAIAYSIEQNLQGRQEPLSAPELVNGMAPEPRSINIQISDTVTVAMTFDISTQLLSYKTDYFGTEDIYAVCLHASKTGAIIQCLSGINGRRMSGELMLNRTQVRSLYANELYIRVYSEISPRGEKGKRVFV